MGQSPAASASPSADEALEAVPHVGRAQTRSFPIAVQPERAEEERRRGRAREGKDARDTHLRRLTLVPPLQLDEDAASACRRVGHGVHGGARHRLLTLEHDAVERVSSHADDASVDNRHRAQRAGRVAVEPPVELGAGHRALAPRAAQQPQVILPVLRAIRDQLEIRHLDDVPSAALNHRRACVPATVSLTPIRSQAPASTSSNVRAGYGSTL